MVHNFQKVLFFPSEVSNRFLEFHNSALKLDKLANYDFKNRTKRIERLWCGSSE